MQPTGMLGEGKLLLQRAKGGADQSQMAYMLIWTILRKEKSSASLVPRLRCFTITNPVKSSLGTSMYVYEMHLP